MGEMDEIIISFYLNVQIFDSFTIGLQKEFLCSDFVKSQNHRKCCQEVVF